MNVATLLAQKFHAALTGLTDDPGKYAGLVKPTADPRHGDYQANFAMPLAKVLGRPPRDVAAEVVARLELGDMLEPPEIAGPGFVNLRLKTAWVAARVQDAARGDRLGVPPVATPRTFVIDFSSPNVAKPMHVGHLRSTIIGAALTRLLRFLGHAVITDNHLGDWGTQFGMLLYGYKHYLDAAAFERDPVQELARLYITVRGKFRKADDEDADEADAADPVKEACRAETAKLHAGDPETVALWKRFMPACYEELDAIYRRLGVTFDHTLGESFYQPMLPGVVEDLLARGLAVPSQGAVVVPPPGVKPADWLAEQALPEAERKQHRPPALIRKRDGASTYTTTDLATIRYRMEQFRPDAILYVVGRPQEWHFQHLFAIARDWGYPAVELEHVAFGSVLAGDGKMFSTRSGKAPPLHELLDEAIAAAARVFEAGQLEARERGEELPAVAPDELRRIHETVGLGAVKYADLSQNRESDYRFDVAKMTATEGNTATYMQYAYARNRSIFRKGEEDVAGLRTDPPAPDLGTAPERVLALTLLRFGEALEAAAATYRPSHVTGYLWDVAKAYSGFFQNCPVLKAETPELRRSRLLLCDLTARVIQKGLDVLGIGTLERM